jgi:spoIIIJ-associated protein
MKVVEATGKTQEEAIANGLKMLGSVRDEVDQDVVSQTEEETRVKLTIKEPRQYLTALTSYILTACGFKTIITVTKDDQGFYVNIKTRHADSLLIGKRGETLWSLQYLISRLAKRYYSNIRILIDVNGYRIRRNNFLKKKAEAVAHVVLETGREMALDAMTKREEKIVMMRLVEIKGIKIYTIGKGVNRNIVIAPLSGAPDETGDAGTDVNKIVSEHDHDDEDLDH